MRIMALLGLLALAACGADGPPMRPGASGGDVSVGGAVEASNGIASVRL